VRGRATPDADAYLGIPYAGVERFAPPRPADWEGDRDAGAFGPVAPQPVRPIGTFTHGDLPATDEQCLSLNVWRPAGGAEGLPVLVWIHGGGFALGWSGASVYDGARLAARERLVVITINYRLGSLGWLSHPDLAGTPGAPAGNWGLLDQVAALRWVRDHVAAFGGDPGRVTLAGQSAGALSIMDHLVGGATAGLFARAAVQSPPVFDAAHDPDLGRRWAEALSRRAGGARGFDVEALRRLPAQRVVELHEELLTDPEFAGTRGGALPMLDPATLPASPEAAPAARPDVDVLVGTTADEGTFFFRAARRPEPDEAGLLAIVGHLPGVVDAAAAIAAHRERAAAEGASAGANDVLVRIATEAMVAGPTARWAAARAAGGGRVFRYRVDHPGPDPDLGAIHTVEVPLLFGTFDDGGPGARLAGPGPASEAASRAVMAAWGAFVRDGDPGWPALVPDGEPAIEQFGSARR
jgi:para-nitrobenzyl esterase